MSLTASKVEELSHVVAELRQHYVLWWALADPQQRKLFHKQFTTHTDFFDSTARAHFQAVIVMTYQLLDERSDVLSMHTVLSEHRVSHGQVVGKIKTSIADHQGVFDRMAAIRSKVFAHRDAAFGPDTIFTLAQLSPEGIGACVDTLCIAMDNLLVAISKDYRINEFYDAADHRAVFARDDLQRILRAL